MNKVILLGRLGRDPELRYTSSGTAVLSASVATNGSKKSGDVREKTTEWHNVVCWGRTAETWAEYLGKGSQVLLEGKLQTRKWEDAYGHPRSTTEIVVDRFEFVGSRPGDSVAPRANDVSTLDDVPF